MKYQITVYDDRTTFTKDTLTLEVSKSMRESGGWVVFLYANTKCCIVCHEDSRPCAEARARDLIETLNA